MTVSVTIPTYNRAGMLPEALDSVLAQTYRDFELIVIDDGSTDETPTVMARYGTRVRYVRQPNGGLGAARNAGLRLATGKYVAFLDSDDAWFDFKLALQVALLEAMPDVGFLFTEFTILHSDGRKSPHGSRTWLSRPLDWQAFYPRRYTVGSLGVRTPGVPNDAPVYAGRIYPHFMDEAFVLPTTAIVRRDAIGALRFTERMTIFEDFDTALNRSHDEPGRLTRCSSLSKAESYVTMLDRVWKADEAFNATHGDAVGRAESSALLAVAREALLQSRHDVARAALERWRHVPGRRGKPRAAAYTLLGALPGGRQLLRGGVISRNIVRSVATRGHAHYPVNPAA
jgi:hypothetical protein